MSYENINFKKRSWSEAIYSLSLSRKRGIKFFAAGFMTLAVFISGGFLLAQKIDTAQAVQTYMPVYADDFNRTAANSAAIGNNWTSLNTGWTTDGSSLIAPPNNTGYSWNAHPIVQPDTFMYGKATIEIDLAHLTAEGQGLGLVGNYNATTGAAYAGYIYQGSTSDRLSLYISKFDTTTANGLWGGRVGPTGAIMFTSITQSFVTIEFVIEPSNNGAKIIVNVYDGNTTTKLASNEYIDTTDILTAGQWGVISRYKSGYTDTFDNFALYKGDTPLEVFSSGGLIKYGNDIIITAVDDEAQTITLSDGGAGGLFSSSAITLDSGNNYDSSVSYTPTSVGNITITATADDGTTSTHNVFVSPYAAPIGFIGDSLTRGSGASSVEKRPVGIVDDILGINSVNEAKGGSRTSDWMNDDCQSAGCVTNYGAGVNILTDAFTAFDGAGVEIVHIMIGQNDSGSGGSAEYKANLLNLIAKIKAHGYRQVILSYPLYAPATATRLDTYLPAIDEVVAESGGYVLLGDTTARDTLKDTWGVVNSDGTHLNDAGYSIVGEAWADAILDNLEYQINPDKTWLNSDNEFTLGETETLTFSVDKHFGEFAGVEVDGVALGSDDYTVTAGSTVIEFSSAYLSSLAVGDHALAANFNGGVTVMAKFAVVAANVSDNNNDGDTNSDESNDSDSLTIPSVPDTGLFGLSALTTIVIAGICAVVTTIGLAFISHKLLRKN